MMGDGHDAKTVFYLDPQNRRRLGWLIHLKDGSPLTLEFLATADGYIALVAGGARHSTIVFSHFSPGSPCRRQASDLASRWRGLERAANKPQAHLRGEPLPEDGPKEVARAANAFNAMQPRIAEQAVERDPDSWRDLAPPSDFDHAHAAARRFPW